MTLLNDDNLLYAIGQGSGVLKAFIGDDAPVAGIILGSGLNPFADTLEDARVLPFCDVPFMSVSTATGHKGRFVLGTVPGTGSRVLCMQADALASPPLGIGKFDVIVSNPPYVPSDEIMTLDTSVRDYEPLWALDGGPDGLKFYKGIIKHWKSVLKPGGLLFLEVGEGEAEPVKEMLLSGGFAEAELRQDSAGTDRVVIGRLEA